MTTFKMNDSYEVVCWGERTRYGFRHLAVLMKDGEEVCRDKVCYYNRTWERYTFETVLSNVIFKAHKQKILSDELYEQFINKIKNF